MDLCLFFILKANDSQTFNQAGCRGLSKCTNHNAIFINAFLPRFSKKSPAKSCWAKVFLRSVIFSPFTLTPPCSTARLASLLEGVRPAEHQQGQDIDRPIGQITLGQAIRGGVRTGTGAAKQTAGRLFGLFRLFCTVYKTGELIG